MSPGPRRWLTDWRRWTDLGALLLLGWFLLLVFRHEVVMTLQSTLLRNRGVIPLLPRGIATPGWLVAGVETLAIPVAFLVLCVTLVFAARPDPDEPVEEREP